MKRSSVQGLTTLDSNCFLNTGFTVTNYQDVLTMYNQGYTRDNLITTGIDTNIIDTAIADVYFIFTTDLHLSFLKLSPPLLNVPKRNVVGACVRRTVHK